MAHFLGVNLNYKGKLTVTPWQGTECSWHGHLSFTTLGPQDKKNQGSAEKSNYHSLLWAVPRVKPVVRTQ